MAYKQVNIALAEKSTFNARIFRRAYVYLPDEKTRLSDLMNDDRKFLPVYKENQYNADNYDMMIVNKDVIAMIEEVDATPQENQSDNGNQEIREVQSYPSRPDPGPKNIFS